MILVDSNVIIDVLSPDELWTAWSKEILKAVVNDDDIAINPIIYAEISVGFPSAPALEAYLRAGNYRKLSLPYEAGFVAGRAFVDYRRRGGARTSPLCDFYIGAHAAISGLKLLTRDARRYSTYFPSVVLIAPN